MHLAISKYTIASYIAIGHKLELTQCIATYTVVLMPSKSIALPAQVYIRYSYVYAYMNVQLKVNLFYKS